MNGYDHRGKCGVVNAFPIKQGVTLAGRDQPGVIIANSHCRGIGKTETVHTSPKSCPLLLIARSPRTQQMLFKLLALVCNTDGRRTNAGSGGPDISEIMLTGH